MADAAVLAMWLRHLVSPGLINHTIIVTLRMCSILYRARVKVVHYIGNRMHLLCPSKMLPCLTLSQQGCVCVILGAGADFVMLGGMLAGHDQCAGEVIERNGRKVKLFYGMSSDTAMKKHVGGVAEYR